MAITARPLRPICLMAGQGNKLHFVLENAYGLTTAMSSTQKAIELGKLAERSHSTEFAWTDRLSALSGITDESRNRNLQCSLFHPQAGRLLIVKPSFEPILSSDRKDFEVPISTILCGRGLFRPGNHHR